MCIRDSIRAVKLIVSKMADAVIEAKPVSYTHLDVYKRQLCACGPEYPDDCGGYSGE